MNVPAKKINPITYKIGIPLVNNKIAKSVDIILEYADSPSNSSPV